ncbi:hypothetical protein DEJ50_25320 [Streptomyces venezuelae]|uniref:Uncharacterized protein n=1 Tax=Streptomyces venezuelae TaxID=54571 RepID=A0A5P2DBM2_STRVZ|nr:hypothetical protein [Streptomyces venezuelae]QES50661.1 hypothetical protein DEJ50_25320 [Streptomyces venezuelae]
MTISAVTCTFVAKQPNPPQKPDGNTEGAAREQYRTGYQQGLKDTLETCEKNPPKGLAAPDPNWQAGYDKGAETALNSKRCQGD